MPRGTARTYIHRNGTRFRACDSVCANAFKTDRRAGLNYGLHKRVNGSPYLDREEWFPRKAGMPKNVPSVPWILLLVICWWRGNRVEY